MEAITSLLGRSGATAGETRVTTHHEDSCTVVGKYHAVRCDARGGDDGEEETR